MKSYLEEVKDLEPEERGNKLSENEAILAAHNEVQRPKRVWLIKIWCIPTTMGFS